MRSNTLVLMPLLVALLACKAGQKRSAGEAAPEAERGSSNVVPAAAESPQAGGPSGAAIPSGGRSSAGLRIVEGVSRVQHGFVVIVGEVHNDTGRTIRAPRLDVALFDAAGQPIKVGSLLADMKLKEGVYADRRFVPPGEKSVFRYTRDIKKLSAPYASHKLTVTAFPAGDGVKAAPVGVKTEDIGKAYRVSGEIENTGSANCRSPEAVIGLYRADGTLWDVRTDTSEPWFQKQLPPGGRAPFEYRAIPNHDGQIAKVEVWADCES